MIAPFEASKLKLERAVRHGTELKWAIDQYLKEQPCEIVVEPFPGMEEFETRAWLARIREPVPLSFSTIIGDVIHNLRAALDLLMCDLARVAGRSDKGVYFPFCETAADLVDTIKKRNAHRAGVDVVDVIKTLKPYKGGDMALRAIHDLDIADKHHALLPVLGAATVPVGEILRIGPEYPLLQNFTLSTLIASDRQIIVGLPNYGSAPPIGTKLPARFFLAFDNTAALKGAEVFKTLHDLAEAANRVFDALTALRPDAAFPSPPT